MGDGFRCHRWVDATGGWGMTGRRGRRTPAQRITAAGRLAWALAREPGQLAGVPAWWRARSVEAPIAQQPWWPAGAVTLVGRQIGVGSVVFEYGGGGSTRWLAGLGATVTTVEHDMVWYRQIAPDLPDTVSLLLREPERSGRVHSVVEPGAFDGYVAAIADYPDRAFDLVIVDGRARVASGLAAMDKVREGGLLLLYDAQRTRYRDLHRALRGWPRTDVRGLKPGEVEISQTTVWSRPGS